MPNFIAEVEREFTDMAGLLNTGHRVSRSCSHFHAFETCLQVTAEGRAPAGAGIRIVVYSRI
jgi:hypothetical protein